MNKDYVNNEGGTKRDIQRSINRVSNSLHIGKDRLEPFLFQAAKAYVQKRVVAGCFTVIILGLYADMELLTRDIVQSDRLVLCHMFVYTDANETGSKGQGTTLYSHVAKTPEKALEFYNQLFDTIDKEVPDER